MTRLDRPARFAPGTRLGGQLAAPLAVSGRGAVILRIFRAQIVSGHEDRLVRFVRTAAIRDALQIPGLVSFQPAVRETPAGLELVIVSTWTDFDALVATGHDLATPISMPAVAALVSDGSAEHYELVIGGARGIPVRDARLRVISARLQQNVEALYFAQVRARTAALLDDQRLVALHLGRRAASRWDDVVAVAVWANAAALAESPEGDPTVPGGHDSVGALYEGEPCIEQFEALTQAEVAGAARAILLADDEGRYLHATPESARLTGRSVARLLTMRVEDLAAPALRPQVSAMWQRFLVDGSMTGEFMLDQPDGTAVAVQFAARANLPWPGCHASLLVGADVPAALDVEAALAEAGFAAPMAVAS